MYRNIQYATEHSVMSLLSEKTFHLSQELQVHLGSQASPFCIATVLLSGEQSRAPFQLVFGCDISALCFTNLFLQHAKLKCFGEISVSEGSPALGWEEFSFLSLLLWTCGEDFSECAEHRHAFFSPAGMWLLPAAVVDAFSLLFFQGHSNLECHITQTQADLWWIPWRWLSMSSPIPPKETRFTLLHLPTATHHLLRMSRWWNPPHEDSVALTWLWEKKVPLQNNQDGGHLPLWTFASFPCPLSLPILHLSSLNFLAKGWFFCSRSGFFLCL